MIFTYQINHRYNDTTHPLLNSLIKWRILKYYQGLWHISRLINESNVELKTKLPSSYNNHYNKEALPHTEWRAEHSVYMKTGLILGQHPTNERRRCKVTTSLIGWAHIRIIPDNIMDTCLLSHYATRHNKENHVMHIIQPLVFHLLVIEILL